MCTHVGRCLHAVVYCGSLQTASSVTSSVFFVRHNSRMSFLSAKAFAEAASSAPSSTQPAAKPKMTAADGIALAKAAAHALPWPEDAKDWTKVDLLGAPSGQASVFLVQHRETEVRAALKYYKPIPDSAPKSERAFMRSCREIAALNRLKDTAHILRLIQTNVDLHDPEKKQTWLLSEFIDGANLSEAFAALDPPSAKKPCIGVSLLDALRFTSRLCETMLQCSKAGVVHRDLKPENVLLRSAQNADASGLDFSCVEFVVCDFGIAWVANAARDMEVNWNVENKRHTELGHTLGNTFYRVPQLDQKPKPSNQAQEDELQASRRSDRVDASGICAILFWLLTATDPVQAKDSNGFAPHQRSPAATIVHAKAKQASLLIPEDRMLTRGQVLQLLLGTFDTGFNEQPNAQWQLTDLNRRLKQILELLTNQANYDLPTGDGFKSMFDSFKALKTHSSRSQPTSQPTRNSFQSAAIALTKAKKQFVTRCAEQGVEVKWVGAEQGKGGWTESDALVKTCRDMLQYGPVLFTLDIQGQIIGNDFSLTLTTRYGDHTALEPIHRGKNGEAVNAESLAKMMLPCYFRLMQEVMAGAKAQDIVAEEEDEEEDADAAVQQVVESSDDGTTAVVTQSVDAQLQDDAQ